VEDKINPTHYKTLDPEPLALIESWNVNSFHLGNVIKYVGRYISKGDLIDLKKARVYLDRFITRQETRQEQDKKLTFPAPCGEIMLPDCGVMSPPCPVVKYEGGTYGYVYTTGDTAFYQRVGGQSQGGWVTVTYDNGAGSSSVDGMGQ